MVDGPCPMAEGSSRAASSARPLARVRVGRARLGRPPARSVVEIACGSLLFDRTILALRVLHGIPHRPVWARAQWNVKPRMSKVAEPFRLSCCALSLRLDAVKLGWACPPVAEYESSTSSFHPLECPFCQLLGAPSWFPTSEPSETDGALAPARTSEGESDQGASPREARGAVGAAGAAFS
jgi:hypothetical protein